MSTVQERMFRIGRTRNPQTGELLHGAPHSNLAELRYLHIERKDTGNLLSGFLNTDEFTQIMRILVSADYATPNWCEKCHIAGHHDCRCEIASNE